MNTSTRNTTGIGWAADNAVAAGLSREEQRRRRGRWLTGFRWERTSAEREREKEKGWRRVMPGDFIGDVSIATARLIRRYELLLAAWYSPCQRFFSLPRPLPQPPPTMPPRGVFFLAWSNGTRSLTPNDEGRKTFLALHSLLLASPLQQRFKRFQVRSLKNWEEILVIVIRDNRERLKIYFWKQIRSDWLDY